MDPNAFTPPDSPKFDTASLNEFVGKKNEKKGQERKRGCTLKYMPEKKEPDDPKVEMDSLLGNRKKHRKNRD